MIQKKNIKSFCFTISYVPPIFYFFVRGRGNEGRKTEAGKGRGLSVFLVSILNFSFFSKQITSVAINSTRAAFFNFVSLRILGQVRPISSKPGRERKKDLNFYKIPEMNDLSHTDGIEVKNGKF